MAIINITCSEYTYRKDSPDPLDTKQFGSARKSSTKKELMRCRTTDQDRLPKSSNYGAPLTEEPWPVIFFFLCLNSFLLLRTHNPLEAREWIRKSQYLAISANARCII